jgi:IS30 family transposase
MTYSQLSLEERYLFSSLLARGASIPSIAREMNRSPSTLYRELKRNLRPSGYYAAVVAHSYATARRRKVRRGSQFPDECWQIIWTLLHCQWSPDEIAASFKRFGLWSISFQTIYRWILKNRRRGGSLYLDLRIIPKCRRKRYGNSDSRGVLLGKRFISERPSSVNDRSDFGHWEVDTVMGNDKHQCILTMVERVSGEARIAKLSNRTATLVVTAISEIIAAEPQMFKTLTFDNGTEFHSYKEIERRFNVMCYFANPHRPWERGSNENFNGLLRQYLPKGTSLSNIGPSKIKAICHRLNTRPRKRLGYRSPQEVYYGHF